VPDVRPSCTILAIAASTAGACIHAGCRWCSFTGSWRVWADTPFSECGQYLSQAAKLCASSWLHSAVYREWCIFCQNLRGHYVARCPAHNGVLPTLLSSILRRERCHRPYLATDFACICPRTPAMTSHPAFRLNRHSTALWHYPPLPPSARATNHSPSACAWLRCLYFGG
jgi:hypothetical protein